MHVKISPPSEEFEALKSKLVNKNDGGGRIRLLLADDDNALTDLLKAYLESEGFEINVAADGGQAIECARSASYDLIILDVMMPVRSGFEVLAELRREGDSPVLMLTARSGDDDRVLGLELGADDYLTKPFNPRELVARVRAILRRTRSGEATNTRRVVGDVELSSGERTVTVGGSEVALTSAEFSLLESLLSRVGEVVDKDELSRLVLGRELGRYDRSIDVHVSHLRRKLGSMNDGRSRIGTVRGVGYIYHSPG